LEEIGEFESADVAVLGTDLRVASATLRELIAA
jgi:hypothetical protein